MIKELDKNLIGKTIYAIPTGHNAKDGGVGNIVNFKVVDIKRVYMTLEESEAAYPRVDDYDINGNTREAAKGGHKGFAGYKFFRSLASAKAHKEAERAKSNLRSLPFLLDQLPDQLIIDIEAMVSREVNKSK